MFTVEAWHLAVAGGLCCLSPFLLVGGWVMLHAVSFLIAWNKGTRR